LNVFESVDKFLHKEFKKSIKQDHIIYCGYNNIVKSMLYVLLLIAHLT